MPARILWIEGNRASRPPFVSLLRGKGYLVDTVSSGKTAVAYLKSASAELIVVDAASMRSSGKRICQTVRVAAGELPILLICDSKIVEPSDFPVNVILEMPFTIRKLINRLVPLLPGDGDKVITAGPITLDLSRKQVVCGKKESQLTPRMIGLLEMLMEKPGEVLERGTLFRKVWRTEYTGDTRTLDVHMSWLRQAIEADPRKPKHIKTIRGVGYRLDI
jgi:DNA-binding response OmpR family regulator